MFEIKSEEDLIFVFYFMLILYSGMHYLYHYESEDE